MARIDRKELTRLELIRHATRSFLEKGYSNSSVKVICKELDISPGVLTFHFQSKDHLLAALVDLLCKYQWKVMDEEANEGLSSVMALCLEFATMVSICEEDEIAKDFFVSAYSSPLCLGIIRKNDAERAKEVFKNYCSDWNDDQFDAAEILVSGIEYATLITSGVSVSLETRIVGALNNILSTFNVPEETRKIKIDRVLAMDYRKIGRKMLKGFKKYVEESNEQAFLDLLKCNAG